MDGPGPSRRITLDPHVHTADSHDCSTPLGDVLAAARDADLDAVAITDHDAIDAALRAVHLGEKYGLRVIPGVEVSTADGHLLALFVSERPPAGKPLAETVAWVHDREGVAVVPHPFQVSRHGVRKRRLVDTAVDGIETFNAQALTGMQNRRARRFADRFERPAFGASDAHAASMVGRAYTELELPEDVRIDPRPSTEAIRTAVRAGRTRAGGDGAPIGQYVGKVARQVGSRTASVGPGRLFSTDRS